MLFLNLDTRISHHLAHDVKDLQQLNNIYAGGGHNSSLVFLTSSHSLLNIPYFLCFFISFCFHTFSFDNVSFGLDSYLSSKEFL